MTLKNEHDLDWVKMSQRAPYLCQRSFRSKVIMQTHTHSRLIAPPGPLK